VGRTCGDVSAAAAACAGATRCSCNSAASISSNSLSCDASTSCRCSQFSPVGDGICPAGLALIALGVAIHQPLCRRRALCNLVTEVLRSAATYTPPKRSNPAIHARRNPPCAAGVERRGRMRFSRPATPLPAQLTLSAASLRGHQPRLRGAPPPTLTTTNRTKPHPLRPLRPYREGRIRPALRAGLEG
jgi:hypothetical protein